MFFKTRPLAAKYLSDRGIATSAQALADMASQDKGPPYSIIRGRALYRDSDLDTWIQQQADRPVIRRTRGRLVDDAASRDKSQAAA